MMRLSSLFFHRLEGVIDPLAFLGLFLDFHRVRGNIEDNKLYLVAFLELAFLAVDNATQQVLEGSPLR